MIFLPADNVEPNRAILISAMISFKISRPRDFETKRFRDQEISRPRDLKTKRSQDQDWRSNNDASIDSRRKSASCKAACVFHSGGHRDERNDFTPRQRRLGTRPTDSSRHGSRRSRRRRRARRCRAPTRGSSRRSCPRSRRATNGTSQSRVLWGL